MFKWLIGFMFSVALQAGAAQIHVDFVPQPGHQADILLTSDTDQIVLIGVQLAIEYENRGTIRHVSTPLDSSMVGFPGAGPNANLSDGDAAWIWAAPFDDEPGIVLPADQSVLFGTVGLDTTQWLRLVDEVGGIPTIVLSPSCANLWDGQLTGVVLPEPHGISLLLAGFAWIWPRRARLNYLESPKG